VIRLMSLQIGRNGIYEFRKVIPERLRPFFGRREFKKSLGTRSLAEARSRMTGPAAEYEQLLANAKQALAGGWSEAARTLVGEWLSDTHRDDRWLRMAVARLTAFCMVASRDNIRFDPPAYAFEHTPTPEPADEALRVKAVHARTRMSWSRRMSILAHLEAEAFGWVVSAVAAHSERQIAKDSPLFTGIAQEVRRRMIEASIKWMSRDQPQPSSSPASLVVINGGLVDAASSVSGPGLGAQKVGLTITQAFEAWRDHKGRKGKPRPRQRILEWNLAVRRFVRMYGDVDMGAIRPQMVRDYREKLLQLPSRASNEIKAFSFDEQAAIAERENLETLAPGTVNKHLTGLRSITEHVIDKMSAIPLELNAARLAKFVETDDDETKRLPFDEDDLNAIFRNLVITDTTGISSESLFWIVLLAPLTGGRLEELGTLRPSNVRTENGIPYIAVERDRAQVRATQGAPEKTLKSSNSDRDIPLHRILLRAGFLQYVERHRTEGAEWLFPDLKANKNGKRTYRVSRLFARYLEDLGITDDEKVFHSFRHSVRRNLRGRAPEEIVDLICGHSDGKVGRRYGRGADMRPLREVIERIDLGGPDWDRVVALGREYVGLPPESAAARKPKQLGLI
jgi:integrase